MCFGAADIDERENCIVAVRKLLTNSHNKFEFTEPADGVVKLIKNNKAVCNLVRFFKLFCYMATGETAAFKEEIWLLMD